MATSGGTRRDWPAWAKTELKPSAIEAYNSFVRSSIAHAFSEHFQIENGYGVILVTKTVTHPVISYSRSARLD
jgi:hypothetical protein